MRQWPSFEPVNTWTPESFFIEHTARTCDAAPPPLHATSATRWRQCANWHPPLFADDWHWFTPPSRKNLHSRVSGCSCPPDDPPPRYPPPWPDRPPPPPKLEFPREFPPPNRLFRSL